jgi:hypothetical protein
MFLPIVLFNENRIELSIRTSMSSVSNGDSGRDGLASIISLSEPISYSYHKFLLIIFW